MTPKETYEAFRGKEADWDSLPEAGKENWQRITKRLEELFGGDEPRDNE